MTESFRNAISFRSNEKFESVLVPDGLTQAPPARVVRQGTAWHAERIRNGEALVTRARIA